ncbi:MAG: hypothetical protein QM733_17315 [Ilumatobacteraceae bacterium]
MEVQLAHQRVEAAPLVAGLFLLGEEAPSDGGEHVGVRARRHQVAGQHRVHLILQPDVLPEEMTAPDRQPPQPSGAVVSNPRLGKEIRGEQLRQDPGVDLSVFTLAAAIALILRRFGSGRTSPACAKHGSTRGTRAVRFNAIATPWDVR